MCTIILSWYNCTLSVCYTKKLKYFGHVVSVVRVNILCSAILDGRNKVDHEVQRVDESVIS